MELCTIIIPFTSFSKFILFFHIINTSELTKKISIELALAVTRILCRSKGLYCNKSLNLSPPAEQTVH